jgi:aryl-alcohol dehydrogenase-like predicted oxidoreductase
MIPLCVAEGVGVIPWSPLARGYLAGARTSMQDRQSTKRAETDRFGHTLYTDPHDWDVVEAVKSVAAQRGDAPARVALAWLLSRPAVVAPIVGASKPAQLADAIASVDITLSAEEVAALEAPYRPHPILGHN